MTVLVLGSVALAAVVLSFALVALTLSRAIPDNGNAASSSESHATQDDRSGASETMSRVLDDIERLAALRERGVLTETEFKAQKAKFLRVGQGGDRPARVR